ncbi:MAG: histidine kinase N-terminal 7TM domain-containing protein [Brevefilum sp.]
MNFPFAFAPNILPSVIAILIFILMALYSIKNRGVPGAMPFAFACLFGMFWSLGLILEISAVALETKIFWHKFMVMWQLPTTTAITCFILEYARPKRWLTRRNLVLLSIVPLLSMIMSITNDRHFLFWQGFLFEEALIPIQTPVLQFFLAYGYLLGVINLIVFIWLFIHSPENRWPVVIMTVGQILVRTFISLELIFQVRLRLPLTAVGLVLISMVYAVVIFRFRILGPIPLAREVVVERIPIGILILDDRGQVSSLNPAAERILSVTSKSARGKPIRAVLPDFPQGKLAAGHQSEFSLESVGNSRDYRLDILILKDWRDLYVGQLLMLADVTEQRKAQARILEQGRVVATLQERDLLARELHDDQAQVLAFIHTQGQTIQRLLQRGDVETASAYLERLVAVAQEGEINLRKSIMEMRLSLSEQGLLATMEKFLAQLEQFYDLPTEVVLEEGFKQPGLDPMVEVQLLRILQEALNNVRKHAQAGQVKIRFASVADELCISVQDDGRGFDLSGNGIDPEQHFGLQMMRERAEGIGGRIQFSSQPGQGTEVRVCVPIVVEKGLA